MNDSNITTGGCLCGAIRFEANGRSLWQSICYCESCCRSAGAPLIAWACFDKSNVKFIKGETTRFQSSPGVYRGFCGSCGTTLTYGREPRDNQEDLNARPDEIFISISTFDDPEEFPPEEHIRYVERVSWLQIDDNLPKHKGFSAAHRFRQHQKSSCK